MFFHQIQQILKQAFSFMLIFALLFFANAYKKKYLSPITAPTIVRNPPLFPLLATATRFLYKYPPKSASKRPLSISQQANNKSRSDIGSFLMRDENALVL